MPGPRTPSVAEGSGEKSVWCKSSYGRDLPTEIMRRSSAPRYEFYPMKDSGHHSGEAGSQDNVQAAVFKLLGDPATYGGGTVRRFATHAAVVFLAGERAIKVKRAVRYPFLDYSTLAKRKAACSAELEVNRNRPCNSTAASCRSRAPPTALLGARRRGRSGRVGRRDEAVRRGQHARSTSPSAASSTRRSPASSRPPSPPCMRAPSPSKPRHGSPPLRASSPTIPRRLKTTATCSPAPRSPNSNASR